MDYTIREIQKQEYPLLDNFLYEAIFIPEGTEPHPKPLSHLLNCRFMLNISESQKMIGD